MLLQFKYVPYLYTNKGSTSCDDFGEGVCTILEIFLLGLQYQKG